MLGGFTTGEHRQGVERDSDRGATLGQGRRYGKGRGWKGEGGPTTTGLQALQQAVDLREDQHRCGHYQCY